VNISEFPQRKSEALTNFRKCIFQYCGSG